MGGPGTTTPGGTKAGKPRAANTPRKTPRAERKTPKAERKTPKAERKTPKAERKTPKVERKTPKVERKTPKASSSTIKKKKKPKPAQVSEGGDGSTLSEAALNLAQVIASEDELDSPPEEVVSELLVALKELQTHCGDAGAKVKSISKKVGKGELGTENGISFLEMKHQLLQSYNANLSLYFLLKLDGATVQDHPVVDRLIYLRTVLEKIRPIDKKLKYQIDKVMRAGVATTSEVGKAQVDPMSFRPNPENLEAKSSAETAADGAGYYKAPHIAAMPYEEDESAAAKRDRKDQAERRKLMASKMMMELRSEMSDRPMELTEYEASGIEKLGAEDRKKAKERQKYEEDNFVRLTVSKKDKKKYGKRKTSALQDIVDFGSFSAYDDGQGGVKKASMRERMAERKKGNKRSRSAAPTEERF